MEGAFDNRRGAWWRVVAPAALAALAALFVAGVVFYFVHAASGDSELEGRSGAGVDGPPTGAARRGTRSTTGAQEAPAEIANVVRGRVVKADGRAAGAGTWVFAQTASAKEFGETDREGWFSLAVAQPRGLVMAQRGLLRAVVSRWPAPDADGVIDVGTIVLRTTALVVRGVVLGPDGFPLEGADVMVRQARAAVAAGLRDQPSGQFSDPGVLFMSTRTSAQGQFDIGGMPDGDWVIEARREDAAMPRPLVFSIESGVEDRRLVLRTQESWSLRGRVVTAEGAGLASIDVAAVSPWSTPAEQRLARRATTGSSGAFELTGLTGPRVRLIARGADRAPTLMDVERGRVEVELVLGAGARLSGRLLVEGSGTGLADARILVQRGRGAARISARTDAEGRFVIERAPVGPDVEVAVIARGYELARIDGQVVMGAAYAPPLLAGDDAHVDIVMRATRALTGRVLSGTTGEILVGARVTYVATSRLMRAHDGAHPSTVTDRDGFRLTDVPAGIGHVIVSCPGHAPATLGEVVVKAIPGVDLAPIDIRMTPARAVTGRVLGPDGAPVAGASVGWQKEGGVALERALLRRWGVGAVPTEGEPLASPLVVRSAEDGTFLLGGLPEGAIDLTADHHAMGQPARVTLPEGHDGSDVEIRFPRTTAMEGRVVGADGETLRDVQVRLSRLEDETERVVVARTGEQGRFRFPGLIDGTYSCRGSGRGRVVVARTVMVPTAAIDLETAAAVAVRGTCVDRDGVGVRRIRVDLGDENGKRLAEALTDERGRFTFPDRQAGRALTLRVRAPAAGDDTASIRAGDSETEFVLDR